MSELQINTTQNVNISFTSSEAGERLLAFLIDWVIKSGYLFVTDIILDSLGFYGSFVDMDQWSEWAIRSVVGFPVMFYTLGQEMFMEGQTVGKRAMKIKVVKIDGYQASFSDYLIRWFFRIVDVYLFGLGFFVMIFNKNNQRIGDMVTGTAVIMLKDKVKFSHTILEHIKDDYKPTYPSVIKFSDNDMRIIKDTFLTTKKTTDHATLLKLKLKIEEVMEAKSVHNDAFSFIDTVLKDYNYYTQNM